MVVLQGKGVCSGVVEGTICFYKRNAKTIEKKISNPKEEWVRFEEAKKQADSQLMVLYEKALIEVGEEGAGVIEVQQMMLEDEDYCESIKTMIEEDMVNAEYAVWVTAENFAKIFSEMDNEYMKARAADIKDVSQRIVGILCGNQRQGMLSNIPVIVAADDLAPSETVQMDKSKILAFVTSEGSVNSHTAILARTMGIPAIIGIGEGLHCKMDGSSAIVDGEKGTIYIEPDEETKGEYQKKKQQEQENRKLLEGLKGKPSVTIDGKKVNLYANIGSPSDMELVTGNDGEGIGLFRSEFLYLESEDYPEEEALMLAYKKVARKMAGKPVIIRTLDIGADKQVDYFDFPKEENPAMGMRAIRLCLTRRDIFKTQLRGIYRASAFGTIHIMFPMITSLWEIRAIKEIVEEVKAELDAEGTAYSKEVELGIMIETPAAAIISDLLAKEVDFFSIGTNDLTQYTLAVDRQNRSLSSFCDEHHEAVLRLIRLTCENAHKAGIWAGICGELGADLSLTEEFLKMGIDELSVSPPSILPLRQKIRSLNLQKD